MTSRPLRRIALGAVVVVVAGLVAFAVLRRGGAGSRPNVIVLVMDTTRADRCSFNGYARETTPRLAVFAKEATLYRDAWSSSNWTGPAHASLFTGLRSEHHGLMEDNRRFLDEESVTLAERLAAAGYATACFSNNSEVSAQFKLTQGFDTVVPLFERKGRTRPWARTTHDEALEWVRLQAARDKPFLLFVNDMEPHLPYDPNPEILARLLHGSPTPEELAWAREYAYPRSLSYDLELEQLNPFELTLLSDFYDAEIATLDAEIGRLLDALRADGLLENTLVVVCADHGENLGDHHRMEHSIGLHRTLCHVPLLVRWPGRSPRGAVVDDVVRLEDVLPSVLEVCGIPVPPGLDGTSLLHDVPGRIALGFDPTHRRMRTKFEAVVGKVPTMDRLLRSVAAAYDGRHHLMRYDDGTEELFDLKSDPGEEHDLAKSSPDVVARLRGLLSPPASPPAVQGRVQGR